MKTLSGNNESDRYVKEELFLAGITPVRVNKSRTEVPYSIAGQLGAFHFIRDWSYWIAEAPEGAGLPLDIATALHERAYPLIGEEQPETYGEVIRVAGNAGCPPPSEWAEHFDVNGRVILDPEGTEEQKYRRYAEEGASGLVKGLRFVRSLDDVAQSAVSSYRIDTQIGLNEFARVLREE